MLLCFSIMLSSGQMLFKMAASSLPSLNSVSSFAALITNYWFYLALVLYGLATLLWIFILQQVALSQAYPFVALGFVIIPLVSWILFKEPLNFPYVCGVALIIAGLGMIAVWGGK
jgi:multidrug transporter EmrE-like cation transporter